MRSANGARNTGWRTQVGRVNSLPGATCSAPKSLIISVPEAAMFPSIRGSFASLMKRSRIAGGKPLDTWETPALEISGISQWPWSCLSPLDFNAQPILNQPARLGVGHARVTDNFQGHTLEDWQLYWRDSSMCRRVGARVTPFRPHQASHRCRRHRGRSVGFD